jgi:DNA-binding winged helix-turn-helix (wHTH) protein
MAEGREQGSEPPEAGALTFGPFSFDARAGMLRRDGREVPLSPRAFGVLTCLLEEPGRVVPKGELLDRVWPDTTVTDHSLTEAVRALRNALGDASRSPEYVQTVHRRGYRFIAAVQGSFAAENKGDGVARTNERRSDARPFRPARPGR